MTDPPAADDGLVFFNYHEYIVSSCAPHGPPSHGSAASRKSAVSHNSTRPDLVVTHFPNPYAAAGSDEHRRTRVVRVPRIFDSGPQSYAVPQFSTYVPGHEPAALTRLQPQFEPAGAFQGHAFGTTSLTPLVPRWLGEQEFQEIVATVNQLLRAAASPGSGAAWLATALDFVTGSLYSTVMGLAGATAFQKGVAEVDAYVAQVNARLRAKHGDLRLVPPSRSAMASLDFQIPAPRAGAAGGGGAESGGAAARL